MDSIAPNWFPVCVIGYFVKIIYLENKIPQILSSVLTKFFGRFACYLKVNVINSSKIESYCERGIIMAWYHSMNWNTLIFCYYWLKRSKSLYSFHSAKLRIKENWELYVLFKINHESAKHSNRKYNEIEDVNNLRVDPT